MRKIMLSLVLLLAGREMIQAQQMPPGKIRTVCGYDEIVKTYTIKDPEFKTQQDELFSNARNAAAKPTGAIFRIPVVFHVVYHTDIQNIPDSVILNQLDILNKAYRKQNSNISHLRSIFTPLSADAEIEFYLATTDPSGSPTTGITRTYTAIERFNYDEPSGPPFDSLERIKYTAKGGIDPWPVKKYLNIWIGDLRTSADAEEAGLQGYATPPNNPLPPNGWVDGGALVDGVFMNFQAIGNNNSTTSYPKSVAGGIYTVHEVAHYLGLRHIWGDHGTPCTADGGDGIMDTPPQGTSSEIEESGCPPPTQNTCGAGTPGDLPDLWENYMDYGSDSCRIMFTNGQVALMRWVLMNQRAELVTLGTGISTPSLAQNAFMIYPQPSKDQVEVRFYDKIDRIRIVNTTGQTVMDLSGNAANQKRYNISQLTNGMYVMFLESKGKTYTQKMVVQK
jgi:hypothetical protein